MIKPKREKKWRDYNYAYKEVIRTYWEESKRLGWRDGDPFLAIDLAQEELGLLKQREYSRMTAEHRGNEALFEGGPSVYTATELCYRLVFKGARIHKRAWAWVWSRPARIFDSLGGDLIGYDDWPA